MTTNAAHSDTYPQQVASTHAKPVFARLPLWTYLGLLINIVSWVGSWNHALPASVLFFPLWFGLILVLDGVNVARQGTSLLMRSPMRFALLFVFSIPLWWAFEGLNSSVQNWHYLLDRAYSPLLYNLLASLCFSTVLPAVMEMSELLASFAPFRPRLSPDVPGPRLSNGWAATLFALGIVMLALPFIFPQYTYGLVWLCLIFLLDPINNIARRKSAFAHLLARDWRFFLAVPLATLFCGFFWELWNYYSLPKWYYTVPLFDSWPHYFEMPLPGLLGYLPFGIEVFAMYQFCLFILRIRNDNLHI